MPVAGRIGAGMLGALALGAMLSAPTGPAPRTPAPPPPAAVAERERDPGIGHARAYGPTGPRADPPRRMSGAATRRGRGRCLDDRRLRRASAYASRRSGSVAFAFLDECGRLLGEHRYRVYESASLVKAMMMAAYLRRDEVADRDLSAAEREQLAAMIERSDNAAADRLFAIVGEDGLDDVAAAAGMHRFESSPAWGGSGVTAADQASFFGRLERVVPRRHERFALRMLAGVIAEQRWGIADVMPKGWRVHLKGGWYPVEGAGWRVNQAATLRRGDRDLALAVLSEGDPGFEYGIATVSGVAGRLLGDYRGRRAPARRRAARTGSGASARSRPTRTPRRRRRSASGRGPRGGSAAASQSPPGARRARARAPARPHAG